MITSRFFKEGEFNRCSPKCSLQDMNQEAMDNIDRMRIIAGIPIILSSAYRSPEWEKSKGRSSTGAHTLGVAFDIKCTDSKTRFTLINAARMAGCTRIGIAKTYIHVDFSSSHEKEVVWLY